MRQRVHYQIRLDAGLRDAFKQSAYENNQDASRVLRNMMREYINRTNSVQGKPDRW